MKNSPAVSYYIPKSGGEYDVLSKLGVRFFKIKRTDLTRPV